MISTSKKVIYKVSSYKTQSPSNIETALQEFRGRYLDQELTGSKVVLRQGSEIV